MNDGNGRPIGQQAANYGHTLGRNASRKVPFTRLTKIVVAKSPAADS